MTSIFSKIITGEIPCHRVHEDDKHLAFLDINPLAMGHVLCIPKVEVNYMYDMSEGSLADLWKFTIPVAKAIDKSMNCLRVGYRTKQCRTKFSSEKTFRWTKFSSPSRNFVTFVRRKILSDEKCYPFRKHELMN